MKRSISLFLTLAMLFSFCSLFASCGGNEGEGTTAETGEETTAETTVPSSYDVTFSVGGVETIVTVAPGETPVYPGEASWETSEHYYKITGWEPEIVPADSDATYTAVLGEYGLTLYNVRFIMPQGIVSVPTHEGEVPTPPEGYETDLSKVEKIGTFERWTPEMTAVTAEKWEENGNKMIYSPVYTYSTRYYDVTFVVKGTEYPVRVAANEVPVCPIDPAESGDVVNPFLGWDKDVRGATQDTVYTAWYGNAATVSVLAAKDGAKAILSMTYDRKTDTARFINSMNKKYGLGGTFMLIAGRWNADNISEWKTLFADGTLDPGCLSMSHTPDTLEGPMSLHVNEIVNSKLRLEGLFPGYGIICFGSPYAQQRDFSYQTDANGNVVYDAGGNPVKVYDGGSKVLAAKTYFAVRNGTVGLNPLSPACSYDAGGWYNLMVQWIYDNDSQTDKVRTNWIDEAVKKGGWLVILAHDFTEGTPPDGYSTTWERGEIFFKHASTYIQSGELWAPSFTDATKYIRERQNATVARRVENGVVYVDLKLRRTTEDGLYMDESVFNYPLTVKVRVPASWQTVSYDQENGSVTATCYTDSADGQRYVNVNLVPGEDGAVTTTGIRKVN